MRHSASAQRHVTGTAVGGFSGHGLMLAPVAGVLLHRPHDVPYEGLAGADPVNQEVRCGLGWMLDNFTRNQ